MHIITLVNVWGSIGFIALGLVIGLVAGFFISRAVFKRQLKKNPPITEKQKQEKQKSIEKQKQK